MFFLDDLHFCYMIILKKKPLVIKEIHKVSLPIGPPFTPSPIPRLQILLSAKWGNFIGIAYQGKDVVFRFIIEYSSLRDFGPPGKIGLFLYEDFWKMIFWLVLKLEKSEKWIVHSPHQTQLENAPTPKRRKGGSYTPWCNFSLVAWNSILKIGCHYFWPRLIALHKNTLTIELKIKTQRCGLTQNLRWVLILVNPVTWGALLTGLSNTGTIFPSGLVCLARKAFWILTLV